jgi:hypothetical protein
MQPADARTIRRPDRAYIGTRTGGAALHRMSSFSRRWARRNILA